MVDWLNPVPADSMRLNQCGGTPGRLLQRQAHDLFDLLIANLSRRSRARFVSQLAMPAATNRLRQRPTVKPVVRSFVATAALLRSPAHSRTIRARKAIDRALRDCLARRASSALCAGLARSRFFGRPRRGSIPHRRTPSDTVQAIYDSGRLVCRPIINLHK
jgi:hypothetical protein